MGWFSKEDNGTEGHREDAPLVQTVINTLTAILTAYGEYGYDADSRGAEELRQLCQIWSEHLSEGVSAPGQLPTSKQVPVSARSWQGAAEFFKTQRQQESEYLDQVGEELGEAENRAEELQTTLRDFALGLKKLVGEDEIADAKVIESLDALGGYTQSVHVRMDELKTRVLETIQDVKSSVERRQERYAEKVAELGAELVEMRGELAKASRKAERDGLTQLYNRSSLDAQLETTVGVCQMTGRSSCLLMIDLDNFKTINDTYGHSGGDAALKALSDLLASVVLRKSDFVARYGGDEFSVVLHNCKLAAAKFIADRLLNAVRELVIPHGDTTIGITISVGIAELDLKDTVETWLDRADSQLLIAKERGRNCVVG